MRPSFEYLIERFDYYNQLCFNGELKRPVIKLNTRRGSVGLTAAKTYRDHNGVVHHSDPWIEISVRYDLPEEEYTDTLLHEMIHYYIATHNLSDTSPHGPVFQEIMHRISSTFGIRITLTFNPSEEDMIAKHDRWRYICTAEKKDGETLIAVIARNKVFALWDTAQSLNVFNALRWYVSDRQIFSAFPTRASLLLQPIDANVLNHYLTGALELEKIGDEIRIKKYT